VTDVVDLTASMGCAGVGYMGAPNKNPWYRFSCPC